MGLKILFILLLGAAGVNAQTKLILERAGQKERVKYLDPNKEYIIETRDTTYLAIKIQSFTQSTLTFLVCTCVPTGRDTIQQVTIRKKIHTIKVPQISQDTVAVTVPFSEIRSISKFWFEDRTWVLKVLGGTVGATLAILIIIPIEALDPDPPTVGQLLIVEAAILAVTIPTMWIGTRKTKYDLTRKWVLTTGD